MEGIKCKTFADCDYKSYEERDNAIDDFFKEKDVKIHNTTTEHIAEHHLNGDGIAYFNSNTLVWYTERGK